MGAVFQLKLRLIDEAEVGFINQARSLERMVRPFALDVTVSQPTQLFIDQRHQLIECCSITVAPGDEQLGHVMR